MCCWAVEHGMTKDDVRAAVANVGKFAERTDYFDRTWDAAENHTRENILAKVHGDQVAEALFGNHDHGMLTATTTATASAARTTSFAASRTLSATSIISPKMPAGRLYHYADGVYRPNGAEVVRRRSSGCALSSRRQQEWSPSLANDVVEFIRVDSPVLWERPPLDVLNVKNGLLRLSDRVLLPHSPDHLSPVQLPVEFDPSATCPAIEKFVNEVFPAGRYGAGVGDPSVANAAGHVDPKGRPADRARRQWQVGVACGC